MRGPTLGIAALTLCATATVAQSQGPDVALKDQTPASLRVVAIGDVHGAADRFAEILQKTGLIDASRRWIGGSAILVQTGDITDRGPQVRAALDLLMALEQQASASGGRVIPLLGNHETMNLIGDLHDVPLASYESFADEGSLARREQAYERYAEFCQGRQKLFSDPPKIYQVSSKDEWMKAHPPGYLEYVEAMGPDGKYGRWLRSRETVVQIGDTLFLHGGISTRLAGEKPETLNRQVQKEIKTFDEARRHLVDRKVILPWFDANQILEALAAEKSLVAAAAQPPSELFDATHLQVMRSLLAIHEWSVVREDGPLWFRGYALWTAEQGAREIGPILERQRVNRIVVGHTVPASGRITPRFQRHVFLIDTGMLVSHYTGGRASALEIQDGRVTALYMDSTVQIDPPVPQPAGQHGSFVPPRLDRAPGDGQWVTGMFGR